MSRDKIVATAIEILTHEGYANFSMRRLAARLGSSPMGIYYYFDSKDELLDYLFNRHGGVADHQRDRPSDDPFERVVESSVAVVRFLEARPWALVGILDGYIGVEEFTRVHLRDLADGVRGLGFDEEDVAETVRGIWRIAIGEAVVGASSTRTARSHVPCAETIESYLVGRLSRGRLSDRLELSNRMNDSVRSGS
ncbi:TetR/AcrR family transcriptional regulator [Tsukamurella ocularis]|uniref:TetR/AcrR family transcriptional regulator n=1 Tax=Tsukamurella ocularis TaxID=1970234 RepID=UPI0021699582|nr:TetR/AcrR family transcriptional regulator [Tsukamurella ocularis]MCS3779439.1 AcrR family transcriptional regulator [Tsukamurella ocularis]MCS3788087.1 AcrR family transcriptional regulator [Tsukamurella ocularis]MCS3852403.1 AcrR family transcriptional regulator [Tsukamurella ocularis]